MFVKICGITRREDALAAVAYGASAVGFVFWPHSPRLIEPANARRIVAALPPNVAAVGVFVNQPADEINEVIDAARLTTAQLHGDETPDFARLIRRPVIKAVALDGDAALSHWPGEVTMLVDAPDPARRGGTGLKADWAMAAAVARRRSVLLAGGLTPANVNEAIASVQPFGIDVSSGVENAPGIKDHARLAALFEAITHL